MEVFDMLEICFQSRVDALMILVPSPHVSPGEKQSGEWSQISWAYSRKVIWTNDIVRSLRSTFLTTVIYTLSLSISSLFGKKCLEHC